MASTDAKIEKVVAREILDSRGHPTVEVEVSLTSGPSARAGVPSGASTGAREAIELRDGDKKRYNGKGVLKAVENVNLLIDKKIMGLDASKQEEIDEILIDLDPAASEFYEGGRYNLRTEKRTCSSEEMVDYFQKLVDAYPICSLEDGLAEDDWDGWRALNQRLGDTIELIGDDLFVTNVEYIRRGIQEKSANAVLIKLNQIGTLTETVKAVQMCREAGWGACVSHRSGETVDSFIADMTVALDTGHLKTGAPCRGERVEKYNQLLRIAEDMGSQASYAGKNGFVRPVRF